MSNYLVNFILSADIETTTKVGKRHGKLVIFRVNSKQLYQDGCKFYLSENKVWLTDYVPVKYISKEKLISISIRKKD